MKRKADIRTYDSLSIGESVSLERKITAKDVSTFAKLSGDYNPLHVDAAYAKSTPFGKRVVHGMLLAALVSELIGMRLPGKHCVLVKETMEFAKPLLIGETVKVTITIRHKSDVMRVIEHEVLVTRAGEQMASGRVHVRVLQ